MVVVVGRRRERRGKGKEGKAMNTRN